MKKVPWESGTVLVVNREEAVRIVVRQALEHSDYRVLEVRDAAEALEICRRPMERIDLLLSEVTLSGSGGWALVERVARLQPREGHLYVEKCGSASRPGCVDARHGVSPQTLYRCGRFGEGPGSLTPISATNRMPPLFIHEREAFPAQVARLVVFFCNALPPPKLPHAVLSVFW